MTTEKQIGHYYMSNALFENDHYICTSKKLKSNMQSVFFYVMWELAIGEYV